MVVYEEDDEKFSVGVGLSRSERYLMIGSASKLTSEVRLLDAANPTGEFSRRRAAAAAASSTTSSIRSCRTAPTGC